VGYRLKSLLVAVAFACLLATAPSQAQSGAEAGTEFFEGDSWAESRAVRYRNQLSTFVTATANGGVLLGTAGRF
jgi:hypothetical protein